MQSRKTGCTIFLFFFLLFFFKIPVDGIEKGHHLEEVRAGVDAATFKGVGRAGLVDVTDVDQVQLEGGRLQHVARLEALREWVHALAGLVRQAVGLDCGLVRDVHLQEMSVVERAHLENKKSSFRKCVVERTHLGKQKIQLQEMCVVERTHLGKQENKQRTINRTSVRSMYMSQVPSVRP